MMNPKRRIALFSLLLAGAACGDVPEKEKDGGSNNGTTNNGTTNNGVVTTNNVATNNVDNNGAGGVQDEACTTRSDCAVGYVCDDNLCRAECGNDADCTQGYMCREGDTETSIQVCKPQESYFILIEDTSGGEACGVPDAGSDIFGVLLEDAEGNQLGWGRTVWDELTSDSFTDSNVLDGRPPAINDGFCPDFSPTNVVALGCGGWLVVDFVDPAGDSIPLESGHVVTVQEYGGQCGTGSNIDSYDAFFCVHDWEPSLGDVASCNTSVIPGGSGEMTGTIP